MWDVVVVGGGPAGSRCAAILARDSWHVLLADAGTSEKRTLADTLNPTAGRFLQRWVRAQDELDSVAVRCRGLLAMWDSPTPSVTDYELQQCAPGYTVMRPAFDRRLVQHAAQDGAVVRRSWTCIRIRADDVRRPVHAEFRTPLGRCTELTRLIIVACGRVGIAGISRRSYADWQLAYATTVDGAETHDLLWVERSENGWWYLTRLSAARAQLVFVTRSDSHPNGVESRAHWLTEGFTRTRLIRSAFSALPRIERVSVHDARASVPAHPCAPRVLLIGDAAGTVDPLSGRGWMHALQTADAAAERAAGWLRGSRSFDPVSHYEENAKRFALHLVGRESVLDPYPQSSPLES